MVIELRHGLALLILVLVAPLVGEETVAEPALDVLVKRLSHEDYKVREQATRDLIARGRETGRKLLAYRNHVDLEVQLRIDHVLGAMDMMAPEKEKALEALMDRLFKVPAEDRRGILAEIAALGTVALDRLQTRIAAGKEHLTAVCTPGAKWYTASDQRATGWSVQLRNDGDRPLFVWRPEINRGGESSQALVPWRPWMVRGYAGGGGFGCVSCGGSRPSIRNASILAPGDAIALRTRQPKLSRPGRWTPYFRVRFSFQDKIGGRTLWFGSREKKEKGEGWEAKPLSAAAMVYVYPDWAKALTGRGLALTVKPKTPSIRAGGTLEVDVCIANQGDETVPVDKDWMRYCWVALAHHKGLELVPGTAYEHRSPKTPATEPEDEFQPHNIAPGESVTQKIAITAPKTEGLYHLAAGYTIPPERVEEEDRVEPDSFGEELVARAVDVRVVAPE